MTRAELNKLYAEATGLTLTTAKEDLERLGDIMAAELLAGGEVPMPGVGKLVVMTQKARKGRNPKTGESIDIPAKKKAVLRVGKEFKEALN